MRIVYYCNNPKKPAGGANVIYHHVKQLNSMGVNSSVLHARQGYRYHWAQHEAPSSLEQPLRENDYVIIPEISAAEIARKLIPHRISYSIFVQNGYYLPYSASSYTEQDIDVAYQHANHILSISTDTSQMVKLHYPELADRLMRMYCSIDTTQFHVNEPKENLISYMPRKNELHVNSLILALKKNLPTHWKIIPIDNLPQEETAQILRKSRIFLSFSNLEGLGLPPLEAALCGNYVIGYHGGGGLDYWHGPNFENVEVGHIVNFVEKIRQRIALIDKNPLLDDLKPGIIQLQRTYSQENEKQQLMQLVESARVQVAKKSSLVVPVQLQKRLSLGRLVLSKLGLGK